MHNMKKKWTKEWYEVRSPQDGSYGMEVRHLQVCLEEIKKHKHNVYVARVVEIKTLDEFHKVSGPYSWLANLKFYIGKEVMLRQHTWKNKKKDSYCRDIKYYWFDPRNPGTEVGEKYEEVVE